jgi:poly-gamma-glutamate capsule biosynthesis protein CapA/YwtB (metallophosphatase superfamily)
MCRSVPGVGWGLQLIASALLAAAPAPAAHADTRITVAASGDFLVHTPVWQRARVYARNGKHYDFAPMFRPIRRVISRADIALCHVETPLVHGPPRTYPIFHTPVALARAIEQTGWDVCSTASNHTLDAGQRGVNETIRALNRAGLRHTGSYRNRNGASHTVMLETKGIKVAFLAYTTLTNGQRIPHPWTLNMARTKKIVRDARTARKRGANAVIVNLHWGTEYDPRPSAQQRRLANALTKHDVITAVVGQHVHVVQPIRWMHGKPVVFGEGNLISGQSSACCPTATQDGLIALIDLEKRNHATKATRVRYLPIHVRHPDYTVVHARGQSRRRTIRTAGRGPRIAPVR